MNKFKLDVENIIELTSKYHSIRVSFKEWIEDGISDTIFCNNFDSKNNRFDLNIKGMDTVKQGKLSQLFNMINKGDLVVVGGKLNN